MDVAAPGQDQATVGTRLSPDAIARDVRPEVGHPQRPIVSLDRHQCQQDGGHWSKLSLRLVSEHYSYWCSGLTLVRSSIITREGTFFLVANFTMALRISCSRAAKRATSVTPATSILSTYGAQWRRGNATVAPTQVKTGAKGPTAMVFMNMGGPSTTDEVHGFLSMLFVQLPLARHRKEADLDRLTKT